MAGTFTKIEAIGPGVLKMNNLTEAMDYKEGKYQDYTPAAAVVAGQMLNIAGMAAMAATAIAASTLGAIQVKGVLKISAAAVAGIKGQVVGWDEDGDPVGGTSGAGALTTVLANADFLVGSLSAALAATDGFGLVRFNEYSPDQPAWFNKTYELKSANYTIDVQDAGKVIQVDTDAVVITLPATLAGLEVIVQNIAASAAALVSISPNANDLISGPDIPGTDDDDQQNTKLTSITGDYMKLIGNGGTGWFIQDMRGIWAEE